MLISKFDTTDIEKKVTDLECQYGIILPDQYRQFLYKYNGGETPETSFRLARISSDLSGFWGLGVANVYFQLERYFDCDEISSFVSEGIFPIGKNSFGDLLFIGIQEEHLGEILFRYHDRPKSLTTLADSFYDFATKCKSKKIKPCRTIEERIAGRKAAGIMDAPPPVAIQEWQKEIDRYKNIRQEELLL